MVMTDNVRRIFGARYADLEQWLEVGQQLGATHMLVVCNYDTFEDSPVYVLPGEDAHKKAHAYSLERKFEVMECYNLNQDWKSQIQERRAWNF